MAIESGPGGITFTGEHIGLYRLLTLRVRLEAEIAGLKYRGRPTATLLRQEFGWTGNRTKLLAKLNGHIRSEEDRLGTGHSRPE